MGFHTNTLKQHLQRRRLGLRSLTEALANPLATPVLGDNLARQSTNPYDTQPHYQSRQPPSTSPPLTLASNPAHPSNLQHTHPSNFWGVRVFSRQLSFRDYVPGKKRVMMVHLGNFTTRAKRVWLRPPGKVKWFKIVKGGEVNGSLVAPGLDFCVGVQFCAPSGGNVGVGKGERPLTGSGDDLTLKVWKDLVGFEVEGEAKVLEEFKDYQNFEMDVAKDDQKEEILCLQEKLKDYLIRWSDNVTKMQNGYEGDDEDC
ncbi:hypothetical protein HK097_009960 [Rhizophlyctis rosea]|uniref:Uncharacterized protein n=1 Tax=Rhizophlyctis rosea TaxID=64517 RepID=A0AAD5X457_9FUNG|nr:hypothetical protein HK097_009960 [Rhizophlyctis rosea]